MTLDTFKPANSLTFATVEEERLRFVAYCQAQKKREPAADLLAMGIELRQVQHCDSAGLAFLIEAKKIARQYGLNLMMHQMPKSACALAEFYGLRAFLKLEYSEL